MKSRREQIVMVTAYDALFASLVDQAGIDVILVGDSVAPVLAGERTTIPATMRQMIYHGKSVMRGVSHALVVVDMPFLSYQVSIAAAVRNAGRILKRTGAEAVKVEGGAPWAPTVTALTNAGIPVMGHLGLTPQFLHMIGGHRVQGRGEAAAERLLADAKSIEDAGAFAIVLELIPAPLANRVSASLRIPTIGIGAGAECDGQVLVLHDLLGLNEEFQPKFLKRYDNLASLVRDALRDFAREVRAGEFPATEHSHAE